MSEAVFSFIIATIISFLGSLQLGPVNLNVINTAITTNYKTSIFVAIGGSLPEIIYCTLAFWGADKIISNADYIVYFQTVSFIFFSYIGLHLLIFTSNNHACKKINPGKSVLTGFLLGILNPLLMVYWLGIIAFINQIDNTYLATIQSKTSFIFGTAFGAFLLLMLLAKIAIRTKSSFIQKNQKTINTSLGIFFIILAIVEAFKIMK